MTDVVEVKTIAEVERIVNGSGLWDGTGPVEFSNDGQAWTAAWEPSDEYPHPQFARVEVYRKEVRIPTSVVIRWDEQFPAASEDWSGKWTRSPMRHFGRTARMVGYRQTFRELLGNIVIEDEDHTDRPTVGDVVAPEPVREWAAEIAAAETLEQLAAVDKAARAERVFTPDAKGTALHRALRARRAELTARQERAETVVIEAPADPEPVKDPAQGVRPGRAPMDYQPPLNRAGRRAAARKKGGRR